MSLQKTNHTDTGLLLAEVILPLALKRSYTYLVPEEMVSMIELGIRVEVEFGRSKRYAGIVSDLNTGHSDTRQLKHIISIIDPKPIITALQLKMWKWVANYYQCTQGEVMAATLPAGFKLASETKICISPLFDGQYEDLNDDEYLIVEALSIQAELTLDEARKILNKKSIYPIINLLREKRMIYLKEEMVEKYKPKKATCVQLTETYIQDPSKIKDAFELLSKSSRQLESLMAIIDIRRKNPEEQIQVGDIYKRAKSDISVLRAIEKKGIIKLEEIEISRIGKFATEQNADFVLSKDQKACLEQINASFEKLPVCLLRGVTGSGKTEIYIRMIQEELKAGNQVLYLLPEIALTTQITDRLSKIFGDQLTVYHSKVNHSERIELWHKTQHDAKLVLGVRSSLFLPFKNLGLVIIDEEHDGSYKQQDPAPRYNGRDLGIYLGIAHKAKVLLGTATPSLESYFNALSNKYGLVELESRFGNVQMPNIEVVDLNEERKKKRMHSHFSATLLEAIEQELAEGRQVILFKNRRGFAPALACKICEWRKQCNNCDVSLTYHKFINRLKCHYCGHQEDLPKECPSCGSHELEIKGYGTEKIEEELAVLLPDAKLGRMDRDSIKGKDGIQKVLYHFAIQETQVLIGTQMVTKGLDFENVGLVGVMSADQMLYYPDFRAVERAYQLMTQVSGRAGRRQRVGRVLIQTYQPEHPVIPEVINQSYLNFYKREISERRKFNYPPFCRIIQISLKHKDHNVLNAAAKIFAQPLKAALGNRVSGPILPGIARVRGLYILNFVIRLEKAKTILPVARKAIHESKISVFNQKGNGSVRIIVDMDPQ